MPQEYHARVLRTSAIRFRQARFIEEFLVDANGKQAAIRAGYAAGSAEVAASKLLRNPKVSAKLEIARQALTERTRIDADRIKRELAIVGFGVMGDFYDPDTGKLLEVHDMSEEAQLRLSAVKVSRERRHTTTDGAAETTVEESVIELKTWDKVRALELLGKTFGMFVEKAAIQADVSLLAITREIEAKERAARDGVVADPPEAADKRVAS